MKKEQYHFLYISLLKRSNKTCFLYFISAEKLSRSYKENLELPLFDLATIVNVTCNFSNDNKLGEGDSRSVFKIDQKACYWIGLSALTLLMALLGSFSIFIKILD
ncbi:hypothetical protein RchiOBHm_Chr3g0484841 [Rosa chinensis]|uniref:Uncharacterized protein n=1 Tax=Rosa chinensis TaxID=74649 RepID=A0A2P6REU5_ROSCH|nr:hypothetical protein RchiOBHm_Chr3g0484841 [Rosa chinensis]